MKKILLIASTVSCVFFKLSAQEVNSGKNGELLLSTQENQAEVQSELGSVDSELKDDPNLKGVLEHLLKNNDMLNIMLDTRFDYRGVYTDDATEQSNFGATGIKLILRGEIYPGVRYVVRQRLNKSLAYNDNVSRDSYGQATDFAYVELDAGKHWTFRLGKQALAFGTFEFDYNPLDLYLFTMVNDDIEAYKTGVNIAFKANQNHTLNLQVVNSDSPQFALKDYRSKALGALFLWEGSLFNGGLKTRYGYGAMQHDASKYYSWITIGNQINIDKFTTELDVFLGDRNTDIAGDKGVLTRDQTFTANFIYNFGKVKPSIRGTWNKKRNQENGSSYKNGTIQAVVEYRPFEVKELKDLRFHAAYAYSNTSYNGDYKVIEDVDKNMLWVGMRWLFKVK